MQYFAYITLLYEHDICILSGNIKFICTFPKQVKQFGRYWLFFLVPKARTNTFYICQPCTCIIYIYYSLRFYFPYLSLLNDFLRAWAYGVWRHFQQYFSYIVAVSFISGGNQSARRKPLTTDLPQVTDKLLSHNVVSSTPLQSEIRTHSASGDRH